MHDTPIRRRHFLAATVVTAGAVTRGILASADRAFAAAGPDDLRAAAAAEGKGKVRVTVWDEQQPEQKQAYDGGFLGEAIAAHLKKSPDFAVRTARFADPEQGLADEVIQNCGVLIWWSHFRSNPAIVPAKARQIVDRIKAGKMSLISLHSAHWSAPFVKAMNDRATEDALKTLSEDERKTSQVTYVTSKPFTVPKRTDALTPSSKKSVVDGKLTLEVTLPMCVFPAYRGDGKPSKVTTLLPDHPIAKGLPKVWTIPQTEMYDEPFHVPPPDEVVFEEHWEAGEHFRSGCVWRIGKGKVFYFRPGHETYPVYKQAEALRVVENACRWLGGREA